MQNIQTIKVTFESNGYMGFIVYNVHGNVQGLNLIQSFDLDYIRRYKLKENPIQIKAHDDDWFTMTLMNNKGDCLFIEADYIDTANMVTEIAVINQPINN